MSGASASTGSVRVPGKRKESKPFLVAAASLAVAVTMKLLFFGALRGRPMPPGEIVLLVTVGLASLVVLVVHRRRTRPAPAAAPAPARVPVPSGFGATDLGRPYAVAVSGLHDGRTRGGRMEVAESGLRFDASDDAPAAELPFDDVRSIHVRDERFELRLADARTVVVTAPEDTSPRLAWELAVRHPDAMERALG